MDPARRLCLKGDLRVVLRKFNTGQIDEDRAISQLPTYVHDSSLDLVFERQREKDAEVFYHPFGRRRAHRNCKGSTTSALFSSEYCRCRVRF